LRHETEADSTYQDTAPSPTPAAARETFLDDPQLLGIRPAPTPTSIYNVKATNLTTISTDIHTDSQLQTR
jgi:hypothetical protein